jgi:hypothetical protein
LKFNTFSRGYKKYCCHEHAKLYSYNIGRKGTFMKKYGVKSPFQSVNMEKIIREKYGVNNVSQIEKIKEKKKETCLKNHGVSFGFSDQEKNKKTCLEKYGVEYPNQLELQYNKSLKTRYLIHKFRDADLWYQGTYELDFLNKYYDILNNIQRGPSIRYVLNNKNRIYFSDFYIPHLNLIVEIKSSWTIKIDEGIIEKKKATLNLGFKYIMILDKKYEEFNYLYVKSLSRCNRI